MLECLEEVKDILEGKKPLNRGCRNVTFDMAAANRSNNNSFKYFQGVVRGYLALRLCTFDLLTA